MNSHLAEPEKQAELLMEDGIEVVNGRVDLDKYGMKF
mgnify:CR=1 FL=1